MMSVLNFLTLSPPLFSGTLWFGSQLITSYNLFFYLSLKMLASPRSSPLPYSLATIYFLDVPSSKPEIVFFFFLLEDQIVNTLGV